MASEVRKQDASSGNLPEFLAAGSLNPVGQAGRSHLLQREM